MRRADDLLEEWGRFGAQVRGQVEREAAAIGEVVDSAVGRAAATGIDRAIGDRLRALTTELERIEQRARVASRAVVEQREADRRILWAVVAGIVLANALLVVLILRKPEAAPVAEPVRLDAPSPSAVAPASGSATPDPTGPAAASQGAPEPAGSAAGASVGSTAEKPGAGQGATTGSAAMTGSAATAGSGATRPANAGSAASGSGTRPVEAGPKAPVAPPARPGAPHPHKKP